MTSATLWAVGQTSSRRLSLIFKAWHADVAPAHRSHIGTHDCKKQNKKKQFVIWGRAYLGRNFPCSGKILFFRILPPSRASIHHCD